MTRARGDGWDAERLTRIDRARELEIAPPRAGGGVGRWTPIWVVVVDDEVFVRTWYRRDTGWYGRAVRAGRARIRVPGAVADVRVEPVDSRPEAVDAAYRAKYGVGGAGSMTTVDAVATTLRLTPEGPQDAGVD